MTAARYADYVNDLKILFDAIDATPEIFRSFDLHIDLAHKGLLFVYETRRKLGQTDSIYYARMAKTGANKQVSQQTAYEAVSGFFRLAQFVALTGDPAPGEAAPIEGDHPTCAVAFTYRKTGMPKAVSMRMIFVGLDSDAPAAAEGSDQISRLIESRPYRSERVWEWK